MSSALFYSPQTVVLSGQTRWLMNPSVEVRALIWISFLCCCFFMEVGKSSVFPLYRDRKKVWKAGEASTTPGACGIGSPCGYMWIQREGSQTTIAFLSTVNKLPLPAPFIFLPRSSSGLKMSSIETNWLDVLRCLCALQQSSVISVVCLCSVSQVQDAGRRGRF